MKLCTLATVLVATLSPAVYAAGLSIPNTYTSGDTLSASALNGNMSAVKAAVNDNDARTTALQSSVSALQATVSTLETTVTGLQSQIDARQAEINAMRADLTAVQNNSVLDLDGLLVFAVDGNGYATARFSGVNVQVVNGLSQSQLNGLGNLIVGYNEATTAPQTPEVCANPAFTEQGACEAAGAVWSRNHKTGSHNLVAGTRNSYASHSGTVLGEQNIITGQFANVTGGRSNVASGLRATVSAGYVNVASGDRSSVSGGWAGVSSGLISSISAGEQNVASGQFASVLGGFNNRVTGGRWNAILGGAGQSIATGDAQSVP